MELHINKGTTVIECVFSRTIKEDVVCGENFKPKIFQVVR